MITLLLKNDIMLDKMKNHLFMIHRAIEPLVHDIQRAIFNIIINKCDYIMENIRCALLNAAALYGTHRDIKFSIEQIDGMYWYKPPCGSLSLQDNVIKPLNSDSVKTIYIILRPYETIETIKRINHKGETLEHNTYRLYGKNSSYSMGLQRYLSNYSNFIIPAMNSYYSNKIYLVLQINLRDYSIVLSKNKQRRAKHKAAKLNKKMNTINAAKIDNSPL